MAYVVLKKLGNWYAFLVKNKKKYGDGGTSSYSTNPTLEGASLFLDMDKANACIGAIKKRRPHVYDFIATTEEQAIKLIERNSQNYCIGKIISGNNVTYYLKNGTFGRIDSPNIETFVTEDEAEKKKELLSKSHQRLLVLNYVLD